LNSIIASTNSALIHLYLAIMSTAAASSSKSTKPTRRSKKSAPVSESSGSETDSSEDVTEDEDGVDLTPALDAAILRTLAKIRNKRGVYEGENVLENELKEAEEKVISAGIKAMPNRKEEIKVRPVRIGCERRVANDRNILLQTIIELLYLTEQQETRTKKNKNP
jgi:hypothetical protein